MLCIERGSRAPSKFLYGSKVQYFFLGRRGLILPAAPRPPYSKEGGRSLIVAVLVRPVFPRLVIQRHRLLAEGGKAGVPSKAQLVA